MRRSLSRLLLVLCIGAVPLAAWLLYRHHSGKVYRDAGTLNGVASGLSPARRVTAVLARVFPSPQDQRQALLEALQGTGESAQGWSAQCTATLNRWTESLSECSGCQGAVVTAPRAYQGGCSVSITYPNLDAFREYSDILMRRTFDTPWGANIRTGPSVLASGQVVNSIILLGPEA